MKIHGYVKLGVSIAGSLLLSVVILGVAPVILSNGEGKGAAIVVIMTSAYSLGIPVSMIITNGYDWVKNP